MCQPCTANEGWVLLYSTLGYEAHATKQVFLRPLDSGRDLSSVSPLPAWELRRSDGETRLRGAFRPFQGSPAIPLLEADLTSCHEPGIYQLLTVLPPQSADLPSQMRGANLVTLPFEIGADHFFQKTFAGMALDGSRAREAPAAVGGGFHDSCIAMGDVAAHAIFAVGLMHVLARRGKSLAPLSRARLLWAIDRAIDYVFSGCDQRAGTISHPLGKWRHTSRPQVVEDTMAGLWALATYADLFRGDHPARARRAWHLALAVDRWLRKAAVAAYEPHLRASVYTSLWWHSGEPRYLDAAVRAAEDSLAQTGQESEHPSVLWWAPRIEGLYWLSRRLPKEERVATLIAQVRNGSGTDLRKGLLPPDPLQSPTDSYERLFSGAIDALYLAELFHEPSLADSATRLLCWVGGLNLGVPGDLVENPPSRSPVESATRIMDVDARRLKPPLVWHWPKTRLGNWLVPLWAKTPFAQKERERPSAGFMTILANELSDGTKGEEEASIKRDGLWLYASCVHGDFFGR